VPGEILSKPGEISKNELGLIKEHSQVGHNILKTIDFPWPIAKIVLQHHEKMNGAGYPDGISGENILLEARVVAVADVVEAMASHRPYRPSLGIDMALGEIQKNKNVFYDPQAVDACLRLFNEKGYRL
jgi:HD-GYP domain-containing protein (c-di-GMP phosphodiesterase class II)